MIVRTPDDGDSERTLKIVRGQHAVPDAAHFAELSASYCDAACREAIVLAASELAENLVKYGVEHQDPRSGTISVTIRGNVARIRVTNAVASADDARNAIEIIGRISSSGANDLYRARVQELFANPGTPRAQLGLLRLVFEGGFRLSACFDAPLLRITAERSCGDL